MVDPQGMRRIEVEVSDLAEFRPLREWLARVPAVEVIQEAGTVEPGEQGAWDVLTVLAGSGGVLAVAVRSLPEFIRSRRSDLTVTVRVEGREFVFEGSNLDQVTPVIEAIGKFLDD
jgi:hypothetical protein